MIGEGNFCFYFIQLQMYRNIFNFLKIIIFSSQFNIVKFFSVMYFLTLPSTEYIHQLYVSVGLKPCSY